MTETDFFRYAPGGDWMLAVEGLALLLPGDTPAPVVWDLWDLLVSGADLIGVTDRLAVHGLGLFRDLAIADRERVLLRGRAVARWGTGTLDALKSVTWHEAALEEARTEIALDPAATAEEVLPLTRGVVRADALVLQPVLRSAASTVTSQPQETADCSGPADQLLTGVSDAKGEEEVTSSEDPELHDIHQESRTDLTPDHLELTAVPEDVDDPEFPEGEGEEFDSYDRLFGATAFVHAASGGSDTADDADHVEVRAGQEGPTVSNGLDTVSGLPPGADESSTSSESTYSKLGDATQDTAFAERNRPPAPSGGTGMITSVPVFLPPPATTQEAAESDRESHPSEQETRRDPGPVVPTDESMVDEPADGLTVSREALAALRAGRQPHVDQVPAVICRAGHLNPPEQVSCRVCGVEVPPQPAITRPRPSLGRLILVSATTGAPEHIELEGSVIVGRRPRVDVVGESVPRLVEIPSPDQDLSRNHLRITVEGWHVLVSDLGSTNGTVVEIPGEQPQLLHEARPTLITPGSRVVLAESVTYLYETGS